MFWWVNCNPNKTYDIIIIIISIMSFLTRSSAVSVEWPWRYADLNGMWIVFMSRRMISCLAIITGQLVSVYGNVQWCYNTAWTGTLSRQSQVLTTTATSQLHVSSHSIFIKRHCLRPPACMFVSGTIEFSRRVFSMQMSMAISSDEHNLTSHVGRGGSLHDLYRATAIKLETSDSFTPMKRDN